MSTGTLVLVLCQIYLISLFYIWAYEDTFSINTREGRSIEEFSSGTYTEHITNLKYKLPSCVIFWENTKTQIKYSTVICNNILSLNNHRSTK